jgi:hypothetical protein
MLHCDICGRLTTSVVPLGQDANGEPDDTFDPSDYDPECRQQAAALVDREGAWRIVARARCGCCGEWHTVDSVWGFVGKSWSWSGYDADVMASALSWLEEHHGS